MTVDFFFDPACPWCWITSRWLIEVSRARKLTIRWRTFSLLLKNEANDNYSESFNQHLAHTLEALEIMEAVRSELGDAPVGDLYTEYGARIHHDRDRYPAHPDVLRAAGLGDEWTKAIGGAKWRQAVEGSMGEAIDVAGEDIGVPTITFPNGVGYFGPVMSPAPTGDDAVALFDRLVLLSETPGFYELKRGRDTRPELGTRP